MRREQDCYPGDYPLRFCKQVGGVGRVGEGGRAVEAIDEADGGLLLLATVP